MSEARVPGSCFCGTVRFSARLPSLFCGHCHCSRCRRSHGAGYVTWFAVPRDALLLESGEADLARFRSSDHRSEEHTSELQSRLHLVCRLLLEKKKKIREREIYTALH